MPDQHSSRFRRLVHAPAMLSPHEAIIAALELVTRSRRRPGWAYGLASGRATRVLIRVTAAELMQDRWPPKLFKAYLRALERGWIAVPNPN